MKLGLFGFVELSAITSFFASPLGSDKMDMANKGDPVTSRSEDPTASTSRGGASIENGLRDVWLKQNRVIGMMPCEWCPYFNRNKHRNHFVK